MQTDTFYYAHVAPADQLLQHVSMDKNSGTSHGTLYVVATPIGNRQDLTERAREILRSVDLIVSENPRASKKILEPIGSSAAVRAYLQNFKANLAPVLAALQTGKSVALISEAGTPGINDPGGELVAAARAIGVRCVPVPGPNAAVTAASVSGFPMDEFTFRGFVPHKKGRQTFFGELSAMESAVIFYESPHRIVATLTELGRVAPTRHLCVARELTKLHEQILVDTCAAIALLTREELPARGEFVLVLAPKNF